ncbi:protein FAM3C [Salminus brasiliensis]|uniref:protein FAM3C n=1 Tax=Salminus brasiliensis TaxID=930266 RepID=UPI003B838B0C
MMYVRRVGPYVVHTRQPTYRLLRLCLMVFILVISIVLSVKLLKHTPELTWDNLMDFPNGGLDNRVKSFFGETPSVRASGSVGQCGLPQPCPEKHFAFKIASGAANVVGPKICFNGEILMGGMTKAWGPGINMAIVNGLTGELISTDSFDMWSGDDKPLIENLLSIENGSLVLIASCDDPATKLNNEARTLIGQLGSSQISHLAFRDSWVFVGGKGINNLKPLEKYIKNDKSVNKYGDWPEMLEMKGCIPHRQD